MTDNRTSVNLERIKKDLIENKEAILVSDPKLIGYLTNYFGFSELEREGYLLVTKNDSYIITTPLHENALGKNKDFKLAAGPIYNLSKLLNNNDIQVSHLYIQEEDLRLSEYKYIKKLGKISLIDLSELRTNKTKEEIKLIKKACDISLKALNNSKKYLIKNITELEFSRVLEIEIKKLGADLAFNSIIAFDSNSATPHHLTDNTKLKKNDIVLIDFGAKYNNYCADITRTFKIGKNNSEFEKAYKVVNDSQKEAIVLLEKLLAQNKKITASTIDSAARNYIIKNNFPSIPHSLGHGIGLNVHESPSLSPNSEQELENGMVFSIEPGVYIKNKFGIRIEDLFTIQNNKLIKLS